MKWFLNRLMIWGAILGFSIYSGFENLQNTWRHRGPGSVTYGESERTEQVTEREYKRYNYAMGGMMLGLGLFVWGVIAKDAAKGRKQQLEP